MTKKHCQEAEVNKEGDQPKIKHAENFFHSFFQLLSKKNSGISITNVSIWLGIGIIIANTLSLLFPLTLLQIYDRVIPNKSLSTLAVLSVVVITAIICEAILRTCIAKINQWLDAKFEYQYGIENIKKIMKLPIREFTSKGIGFYLEKLEQMNDLKNFYAGQALTSIFNTPFIIIFLLLITHIGGYLVLAPITVITCIALMLYYLTPQVNKSNEEKQKNNISISNFTINTLNNIHYIKSQALESQMLRRHERLYQKKRELHHTELKKHLMQLIMQMGSQLMMILVAIVGAPLVMTNSLSIGGLAACIIISSRCVQPLNTMAQVWIQLQTAIETKTSIDNAFHFDDTNSLQNQLIGNPIEIHIDNVSILKENKLILKNINLHIHHGICIAIEGSKGLIKSVLFEALLKDTVPNQGNIYINKTNINEIPQKNLATVFSYITKDQSLYNATILENLTEFHKNRDSTALQIAEEIGLMTFVNKLPQGIHTELNISAINQMPSGIKQLITITRGLTRPSSIILFDEANAYLSIQSDKKVINLLKKIKHTKTIIIASQRQSLNNIADVKYKIEKNRLLEVQHA